MGIASFRSEHVAGDGVCVNKFVPQVYTRLSPTRISLKAILYLLSGASRRDSKRAAMAESVVEFIKN